MPTSQVGVAPSVNMATMSVANSTLTSPTEEARLNNATPAPHISQPRRNVSPPSFGGVNSLAVNVPKRPNDSLARQQQAHECDYDVSPTDLYQAIEAKQWEYVHRLFQVPPSGGLSIAKPQASTWVVRKEQNGKLRWRLLPIHAAIIFQAPTDIVERLLAEYPEGASCKDDQGMLPLHLAMRNTPSNFCIIEELLTVHPAAVYVKDRKGRTPLQGGMAAIKDAEARAALQVMDLYTHIATAGEKQRWIAEQRQAADQRLAATQEQHIQRLTALKSEFEREYQELEDAHISDKIDLQNTLEITTEREQRLRKQLAEVSGKLHGSHYESMQHREFELKEQNQELRLLITKLLDQHASLALNIEKANYAQKERQEKRATLMQQCVHLDEEITVSSNKHTGAWKKTLDEVHDDVTQKMAHLFTVGALSAGEQPNRSRNNSFVKDEKKDDNSTHNEQADHVYPNTKASHSDSEGSNNSKSSKGSKSSRSSRDSRSSNGSRKPREPQESRKEKQRGRAENSIVEVGNKSDGLCGAFVSAPSVATITTVAIDP